MKLLIALLLLPILALAETKNNLGYAFFALNSPRWDCKTTLELIRNEPYPRISLLWNTFGNNTTCLESIMALPQRKLIQIHLINEPCSKNRRCGRYEFLHGISSQQLKKKLLTKDRVFMDAFKAYTAPVREILAPYHNRVDCYISPLLESIQSPRAASNIVRVTKILFPSCRVVWSPLVVNGRAGADYLESHSLRKVTAPCFHNLDGLDYYDIKNTSQFYNNYKKCKANFIWVKSFNLNKRGGNFIDPRKRERYPTAKELKAIRELVRRR